MAEVLVEFESEFKAPDGRFYDARACARRRDDGLWEAWLEFIPRDGGETVQTGRETTQPNRDDALYWATGLTTSYIDGALHRTLTPSPAVPNRVSNAQPTFTQPRKGAA